MWFEYKPYVSVAQRRDLAAAVMTRRKKKGLPVDPVVITGKGIATSFWGRAWCDHLEALGDFANRLPRGRTYARNGSVCHLEVAPGRVEALVMGSELYKVELTITRLPATRWQQLKKRCAGAVGSVLELLEGRLSNEVMREITDPAEGMFPTVRQITTDCSCPDWAGVCKHVAAAFYGVGARLDERPELLFLLRGVDHQELIEAGAGALTRVTGAGRARRLSEDTLGDVFGIELVEDVSAPDNSSGDSGGTSPRTRARKDLAAEALGVNTGRIRSNTACVTTSKPTARSTGQRPPKTVTKRRSGGDGHRKKTAPTVVFGDRAITGASVAKLRRSLGLSRAEFSRLLGVSTASVARWESVRGRLGLHSRSEATLKRTARMTPLGARRVLNRR